MKSVFNQADATELINRINTLSNTSKPLWGKMSVSKMLAHCNVPYSYTFEKKKLPTWIH